MDGIKVVIGEDGVVRMYEEPFATIECATEEDFEYIKSAVEFRKKHKWIPVTERLPEVGEEFVLAEVSGRYRNIKFANAVEMAMYYEDGWQLEAYPEWENPKITHWMPLPDPPGISEQFQDIP